MTLYRCDECDTDHTSLAALKACDCGDTDNGYSPSRGRVSYVLGYD